MSSNDYYNTLIINTNQTAFEFEKAIKEIQKGQRINIKDENPAKIAMSAIYKLKEFFEEKGLDIFREDSYLKFAYLPLIESTMEDISHCLSNMLTFSNVGLIERIKHKKLMESTCKIYLLSMIILKEFDPKYIGRYIKIMLVSDRDYEAFKPGMFYKFIVLITNELKSLGIDFTEDPEYINIMNIIREKEETLKLVELDEESFDSTLNDMSIKYNTDFISLDKKYGYRVIDNPEEVKKMSI